MQARSGISSPVGSSYSDMLEFLYPLQHSRGIRFGLANIRKCLERLGSPQKRYLSIHVAGTKGKGSTAKMLHSILTEAGVMTGLYTSPHLVDFRERFVIGRGMASREDLEEAFREVLSVTDRGRNPRLTFFEYATAMAFLLFARRGMDAAILEAGMGGRLDATRAAGGPVTLISPIGLEHQRYLGQSIEAIAREKAGLIAHGGITLTSPQKPEVLEILKTRSAVLASRIVSLDVAALTTIHGTDLNGTYFDLAVPGYRFNRLYTPLPGRHQAINASLAVMAALCLEEYGLVVDKGAIVRGLSATRWPGRMEAVGENPTVILDAAHTADSMRVLVSFFKEVYHDKRFPVVLGIMADKDIPGIMEALKPLGGEFFLSTCRTGRAASALYLSSAAASAGLDVAGVYSSVYEALKAAIARARGDGPVVVTGSLYTVGDALDFLGSSSPCQP